MLDECLAQREDSKGSSLGDPFHKAVGEIEKLVGHGGHLYDTLMVGSYTKMLEALKDLKLGLPFKALGEQIVYAQKGSAQASEDDVQLIKRAEKIHNKVKVLIACQSGRNWAKTWS